MNVRKIACIRMIKILALLLPAVLLISLFPVNQYGDATRLKNFYLEEPDSLDVVLIGSSENYAGFSPVLAYEEYGFTSYLYTISANAFRLFEVQLEEVLRVQSPKTILVDVGEVIKVKTDCDKIFRQLVAAVPFGSHKIDMIRRYAESDDILSYYFPFTVVHGDAAPKDLLSYLRTNEAVRRRGYSLLKGVVTFTGSGETWDGPYAEPIDTAGDHSTVELSEEIVEEWQYVLDACRKHPEVQFIFINTPHRITTEENYRNYQITNALGQRIEEEGYAFINLESMTDAIGLVPETDFYNNAHMNLYGQYKATRFLCDILTGEFGVEGSTLSSENRERWEHCVAFQKEYFRLFEEEFQARKPGEFGKWLEEDIRLLETLEQRKAEK